MEREEKTTSQKKAFAFGKSSVQGRHFVGRAVCSWKKEGYIAQFPHTDGVVYYRIVVVQYIVLFRGVGDETIAQIEKEQSSLFLASWFDLENHPTRRQYF